MTVKDEILVEKEPALGQLAQKHINDHIYKRVLYLIGFVGILTTLGVWNTFSTFQNNVRVNLTEDIKKDSEKFEIEARELIRIDIAALQEKTTKSLDDARDAAKAAEFEANAASQLIERLQLDAKEASKNISDANKVAEGIDDSVEEIVQYLIKNEKIRSEIVAVIRSAVSTQIEWIKPELENGWRNFGSGYSTLKIGMDALGFVHIQGLVASGPNGVVFSLPESMRPLENLIFPAYAEYEFGRVDISPEGKVTVNSPKNGWLSLDGITFYPKIK